MKAKKILVLALTTISLSLTACGNKPSESEGKDTPKVDPLPAGTDTGVVTQDVVEHEDTTSVYETIGDGFTIDKVEEDAKGLAWATVDGKKYELGMDFLSMAMVYNVTVPQNNAKYKNADDVYNQWWKLYIQRWNYLMPEIPLYSNQYFDLYNPKLSGFVTSPYWGAADAVNKTSSNDGKIILGSGTALGGAFRNASWGKSSPAASDNDIVNLTSGYSTVMSDINGSFQWNLWNEQEGYGVLDETPALDQVNADGSLTITLKIHPGLKFSDNSEIKAVNYLAGLLVDSTDLGKAAGGKGMAGQTLVGFSAFKAGAATGARFSGVKLLDDYTFSVTYIPDYAGYYYTITMAGFSPDPLALYLGDVTDAIKADPETKEVYLDSALFAKTGEGDDAVYTQAAKIKANMSDISKLPYSGPFKVKTWDKSAEKATLERNPVYPGDAFRGKAPTENPINEIAYIKVESETQNSKFEAGEVDVLAGITGGDDTKAALALVAAGKAKETHYDRAGYGKLGFRGDFGPSMFASVRRAIAYSINRPEFANTFTGGYGSVVDGPYYEGYSAFQAVKQEIKLNSYVASTASAIKELEADGWLYDKNGNPYNGTGVRYRKLSGIEKTSANLAFKSIDGKYKTEFVNGNWLMPLVINWFGTQPNNVTDLLLSNWQNLDSSNGDIGMYITYTSTDFITGLYGELNLMEDYGYTGVQRLNAINFASSFSSAAYDYAFNWSIDPAMWDYSACYMLDEADFLENYK